MREVVAICDHLGLLTGGYLRELASLNGVSAEFQEKLEGLIELRRRKSAFMKKMQEAELA